VLLKKIKNNLIAFFFYKGLNCNAFGVECGFGVF
jgi:hypothetical protein